MAPAELTALLPNALIHRWKRDCRPATVNNYVGHLRQFLRWVDGHHPIPHVFSELEHVRPSGERTNIATPQERAAILKAAPRWLRCFILLACDLAFRFSTAARAAPQHYNPATRILSVPTKGGDNITLPVTEELHRILDTLSDEPPAQPFWEILHAGRHRKQNPTANGRASVIRKAWATCKRKAGITRELWIHDLRRTTATALYRQTKDLRLVQQLLGHRSLATTARYLAPVEPEALRPLLNSLYVPRKEHIQ